MSGSGVSRIPEKRRNIGVRLARANPLLTARTEAKAARSLAEAVVEFVRIPLVILNQDLRVVRANQAFWKKYRLQPSESDNQLFLEMGEQQWDLPGLETELNQLISNCGGITASEFEREYVRRDGYTVRINLRRLEPAREKLILVVIEDITERKQAEGVFIGERQQLEWHVEAGAAELEKTSQRLQREVEGRVEIQSALHASEHALLLSREELRRLSASLMNAQDAERRRVSRELHDDLSQKVARLQFEVERLEQKVPFTDVREAKERFLDISRQAAGLSNDLRRVAHQLHPATLEHLGLAFALRSYAEEFSRSTAIPVKFTSLFVPRKVPIELASGLYRIVQEALRNVGKHSSNAEVEIVLARAPEGLALFIRDNGDGFDIEEVRAKGGLGLISMQERVRLLDGRFSVETQPGKGVLIAVQCPLPPEEQ